MEPDGPEQREAYAQEQSWAEDERIDAFEDASDSDLMDIAEAKMLGWALDRVYL
jgi:hypothetical protein